MATHSGILAWKNSMDSGAWRATVHGVTGLRPQHNILRNTVQPIQFSSVQSLSCVRLCDPMDYSTPGLTVDHQLPEFTQTHVHCGEGNGTPLQYSCLENPMDGGACWAAIHGVTESDTTSLSLFSFMHWRRKWQPIPVFLPGESQGWWSLMGCRLRGRTESDTTEAA